MSNYLDNILKLTGEYAAEYLKQPIATKPTEGCDLPPAPPLPPDLSQFDLPDVTKKFCAPLFVQFPLVPAPFAVPENCIDGITINTKQVGIYANLGDAQPVTQIAIGASRSPDNFCSFDLNIPDVVIPCFPLGPMVDGTASITVVDPNSNSTQTSAISIDKNNGCSWSLNGEATITLPKIPCPSGPVFYPGVLGIKSTCDNLSSYVDNKSVTITKDDSSECAYRLNMPQIEIPCYPDGPVVRGGVTVRTIDSNNPSAIFPSQTVGFDSAALSCCDFNLAGPPIVVDIPCASTGVTTQVNHTTSEQTTANLFGTGATAIASTISPAGVITAIQVTNNGTGYRIAPVVVFTPKTPGVGHGASAVAILSNGTITELRIIDGGTGYTSGVDISFTPQVVTADTDSKLLILDPKKTSSSVTPLPVIISKSDFCNTNIALPPINIPCYPDGIQVTPIRLIGKDMAGAAVNPANSAKVAVSNDTSCEIGGDLNVPFPVCENGFSTTSTNFKVKINSSRTLPNTSSTNPEGYSAYNALEFKTKTSIGDAATCGFEIGGEINLGLAGIALCSSVNIGKTPLKVTLKEPNNVVTPTTQEIKLDNTTCDFTFTQNTLEIPTMVCDTYTLNPTVDHAGAVIPPVTVIQGTGNSNIRLVSKDPAKPYCSLGLTGQIVIPRISGSGGVGTLPWTPDGTYPEGSTVLVTYPEGGQGSFIAESDIGLDVMPDTPEAQGKWKEQYVSYPGKVFPAFTVIKCAEADTTGEDWSDARYGTTWLKVVPSSYLFQSEQDNSRYPVFGLDTPFKLAPGQIVYLETVLNISNNYAETSVAYAAVCAGEAYDFDIGVLTDDATNFIPASKTNYKLLSVANTAVMNNQDPGYANYCASSVANIIGLSSAAATDLTALLKGAITKIANKGNGDTGVYQLKAWRVLARASDAVDMNLLDPVTGKKVNKPKIGPVTLTNGNNHSFNVAQIVSGHQQMVARNIGNIPLKLISQSEASDAADLFANDAGNNQPAIAISITNGQSGAPETIAFTFDFGDVTSSLMSHITQQFTALNYTPTELTTALKIGTKSNDIHVYYTIDNTLPTINTIVKPTSSRRYDPAHPPTGIPYLSVNNINWIAVYNEYTTAPYKTQVNQSTP